VKNLWSRWFNNKKEFNIDDCVPVTVAEVEVYREKIQNVMKPYLADGLSNRKNNNKTFRQVALKFNVFHGSLEKFVYEEDTSYYVMAKLVKKLKEAGL